MDADTLAKKLEAAGACNTSAGVIVVNTRQFIQAHVNALAEIERLERMAAMLPRTIATCRAYHDALDTAFALLIDATRGKPTEPFFPSKSPMWPAMVEGKKVTDEVEAALKTEAA